MFNFDRRYTSQNPGVNGVNGATPSGNALASLLLGYPSGDPGNQSRVQVSSAADYYVHYFGGFIQDDFRVNAKLTINAGLRIEHETGLREKNNQFTVAFDRTLNPGGGALYLLSDLGRGVTGEILHVDAGYHVVGMKNEDAPDISVAKE